MRLSVLCGAGALALSQFASGQPAQSQAMRDVTAMVEAFGRTCVPPDVNMDSFGKELWQARGLILVDILMADGPGKTLFGLVFDTDAERFRATFPEFASQGRFTLAQGWTAERQIDMTHFRHGTMNGSEIARPMLLCTAVKK